MSGIPLWQILLRAEDRFVRHVSLLLLASMLTMGCSRSSDGAPADPTRASVPDGGVSSVDGSNVSGGHATELPTSSAVAGIGRTVQLADGSLTHGVEQDVAPPSLPVVAPGETVVYETDFADGLDGWFGNFSSGYGHLLPPESRYPLEWNKLGYARSESVYPHLWAPDGNHSCWSPYVEQDGVPPCSGWLSLVFIRLVDGQEPLAGRRAIGWDLTGSTLSVVTRAADPEGNPGPPAYTEPRMFVWVQSFFRDGESRLIGYNYVNRRVSIALTGDWIAASIKLDAEDFDCAGSSSLRRDFIAGAEEPVRYDC